MPAKRPPRQYLTRQVLQILTQRIVARGLGPNDRLPTEHELAAELDVSRNTVREALGSLEAIGAISRRPKRGAVLQPVDLSALAGISQVFLLRSAADFAELLVARRAFEIGLLPLVAEHATPHDFQQMEAANALIVAEVDAGWLPLDGDLAFHKAILNASHNRFLIQFGRLLEAFFCAARTRTSPDERVAQRTLREHRQIVQALTAGNVSTAQRVMEKHLNPQSPRRRATSRSRKKGRSSAEEKSP
jgi:GntR family transcriptional regulator, transcriptional repressor for pyruvate dehydrogenase complex